jgi:hypothetical protein
VARPEPSRDFEVTFAGNTQARFENIRVVAPLPSQALAELLRTHVFLAASREDPCSNALIGLSCGLPAAYRRSGGHPARRRGRDRFRRAELPGVLSRLVDELEQRRAAIRVASLADVADRYLGVLRG